MLASKWHRPNGVAARRPNANLQKLLGESNEMCKWNALNSRFLRMLNRCFYGYEEIHQGAKTEVWIGSMKGLLRCAPWTKPGVSNKALAQSHLFLRIQWNQNKRTPTNFGSIPYYSHNQYETLSCNNQEYLTNIPIKSKQDSFFKCLHGRAHILGSTPPRCHWLARPKSCEQKNKKTTWNKWQVIKSWRKKIFIVQSSKVGEPKSQKFGKHRKSKIV